MGAGCTDGRATDRSDHIIIIIIGGVAYFPGSYFPLRYFTVPVLRKSRSGSASKLERYRVRVRVAIVYGYPVPGVVTLFISPLLLFISLVSKKSPAYFGLTRVLRAYRADIWMRYGHLVIKTCAGSDHG